MPLTFLNNTWLLLCKMPLIEVGLVFPNDYLQVTQFGRNTTGYIFLLSMNMPGET